MLTSGRDLDPAHPAFHATARPIVFCPESSAAEVARRVERASIEVVGHPAPDLRAAIDYLRYRRGARRITIEAGPSTAIEAYRDPALVDELLLSVFLAGSIPDPVASAASCRRSAEIERIFGAASGRRSTVEESSGRWRFERYRCAMVGGEAVVPHDELSRVGPRLVPSMSVTTATHTTHQRHAHQTGRREIVALALGALGVVYGDIGTSPLYAMREAFHGPFALAVIAGERARRSLAHDLGADPGGRDQVSRRVCCGPTTTVRAASSRCSPSSSPRRGCRRAAWPRSPTLALFGAALLYGDGVITPAMSVLVRGRGSRGLRARPSSHWCCR